MSTSNLKIVQKLGLIHFTFLLIYSGLEFTLTFFTHLTFHYTSMQQGQIYFIVGVLMIIIQGGYVRRIPSETQASVANLGLLSTSLSFLLIALTGLTHSKVLLYVGLVLFAFGSATVVTSLTTMLSSCASDTEQGTMLGLFRSLGALARALGPCLASAVFWLFGAPVCYGLGSLAILLPYYMLKKVKTFTPPGAVDRNSNIEQ